MSTQTKTIEAVIPPPPAHMVGDGFRVHSFFPNNLIGKKRMSPFFLLDYNAKIEFSAREEPRGVGVHPHRGFETVTIVYKGKVAHHDSAGHSGVIGEGDVQWMTAASGLLHKEYHEKEFSRKGGIFQMVQLWVNLPAQYKMSPPKYQEITNSMMGRYLLPDNNGEVEVIAGELNEVRGAASTFTPMQVYNAKLKKDAVLEADLPSFYNTGILVVEGSARINDADVPADHFVLFKNEGEHITISAGEDAILLILSGEPIDEPIAQYGPFLMNTYDELDQAIRDVSLGKFGVLEE
ncbi:pirin family protein [Terrimonas sp. NA20]|uniref:Pirin family protein n=1 Tax=Terrimonas ginsenosidimutans TaxID=2908004 RepID=A0ABS9KXG7_9BACT|nr:pirin family protein [Terrimonas ginsenosidimutans]MCG2617037.1 pirin family protein [Terrimonas ginsenosidimutans]